MVETTIAATSTAPGPAPTAAPQPSQTPQGTTPPAPRPGAISADQYHRLDPSEQVRWANLPGGQWIERSKLEPEPAEPGKTTATDATATAPALVPGEKYKFGDLELSGQEILDLLKFKGETDLRRAAVPADPSQYKIEFPKEFVLPAGLDFKFNEADPALAAARTMPTS